MRVRERHDNLMAIVGEWFPNIVTSLDRFFANCAGVSPATWKESRESVIAYALYRMGKEEDYLTALTVVKKGYECVPEDRESSWLRGNEKFVEFSITGEKLHELYFSALKKVLGNHLVRGNTV